MNRTLDEDPWTLVFHKEISWPILRIQTLSSNHPSVKYSVNPVQTRTILGVG